MDGGRSERHSPKGTGTPSAPGRRWTQGQESSRGPGGPAGAQPCLPLCSLSAPGQFRDPAQAGGGSEAGIVIEAGVGPQLVWSREPEEKVWVEEKEQG